MATRRRRRWIRLPLPSALIYAVGVSVTVAFTVPHRSAGQLPVWAAALILVVAAVALFVPIRGRLVVVEWFAVLGAFLRRRRRPLPEPMADAADVSVISGDAGVRWDGHTLVAAVEVAPNVALTREAGGRATSDNELPLALVASLMTQYGLRLDIDVVSSGRHVPPGTAYRTVYSQFVGPRPIIAQRRTWLVLRLNSVDNLDAVVERGPSRTAGPKALAAAAHRVVQRLQQDRIRAHALSADELDAMADLLAEPVGAEQNREKWSVIRSGANFVTTYLGNPAMLADGQLNQWWSWRTEDVVTTIRLTGASHDDIQVGVLVRYVHHGKAYRPLPEAKLSLPTGVQREMFVAGLPGGDRSLQATVPTVSLAAVRSVRVPIGPSGQIVGQLDDGTIVAVPLWDQSGSPQRLRIDARVGVELARQLVLRAVVSGAVVAVHTDDRRRWDGLLASVNDAGRLFYATAGARDCDIAVFDGGPVTTVPTRTVLRLLGSARATVDALTSSTADMTLVEAPGQLMEVTIGGAADPVLLWVIRTREEDRYLGLGQVEAPPRRVVSTEPALSRVPRRPAPPPVFAPGPPRPQVPVNGGHAPTHVSTHGRSRDIAGPQRVPRSQRPDAGQPPPDRRVRRDYRLPQEDRPPHDR